MKKVLFIALLFAACSKQTVKPEAINNNCGVIIAETSEQLVDAYHMTFNIKYTYTVIFKDNSTAKFSQTDGTPLKIGDEYCK